MGLVVVVGILVLGDDREPAPDLPPTTTTSTSSPTRQIPSLAWALAPGGNHELGSVVDLERDRTMVELRRVRPGAGLGEITSTARRPAGDVVTFTADLRVSGTGRAWIGLGGFVENIGTGGEPRGLDGANTSAQPVVAGTWERRTLSLVVPEGAVVIARVVLDGDGAVLVDPIDVPLHRVSG